MNKIKVIHILSDKKFIFDSKRFEGGCFENTTIIISEPVEIKVKVEGEIQFFQKNQINEIVTFCKEASLVVLHDLDTVKSRIALKLPKSVKIAWRFYGYELYSRKQEVYFSELTKKEVTSKKLNLKEKGVNSLVELKSILTYGSKLENVFWKAIARIDLMLVLSFEEYKELSQHFEGLPKAIKVSHMKRTKYEMKALLDKKKLERRSIVLGNNRSPYNNHLDLFAITKDYVSDYDFKVLFNYGAESDYSRKVRKVATDIKINLIDDFMTFEDFGNFYHNASALCINGYRQMAVGNISKGIEVGVKIYLNKKNAQGKFFINEGMKIFSTEDFEEDLKTGNVFLDEEDAIYNVNKLFSLCDKYPAEKFQQEVLQEITNTEIK